MTNNPLFNKHKEILAAGGVTLDEVEALRSKFAFAIPNDQAIEAVAAHSPIIEVGAGLGYWAKYIDAAGADIVAYDHAPAPSENRYTDGNPYYTVAKGGCEVIEAHPKRTLFLCWPPADEPMAMECLRSYTGRRFLFVGMRHHSRLYSGDAEFHDLLDREWDLQSEITLPHWPGFATMEDGLFIFERRGFSAT